MTATQPPLARLPKLSRRHLLVAATAPWLAACGTPLPLTAPRPGAQAAAEAGAARLRESADAHGLADYRRLRDINVSYDGQWRPFIDRIQPVVVDKAFRGSSQERLMPAQRVVAQAYTGPAGRKQVVWQRGQGRGAGARPGEVEVWFNGERSRDEGQRAAAALVAEGYGLFLLGPLWLADRGLAAQLDGTRQVDGRLCDVVEVWMEPGLGQVALDRVSVFIDRKDHVTRRVRFTLEGYENTQGAVAEVDTFEHERHFGVLWPRRSYERVVHPLRLPAHDWRLTGLDVNRGYGVEAIKGATFAGEAARPAQAFA